MIICDTGPLFAVLNADDKHHKAAMLLLDATDEQLIVPGPIVTEVCYLAETRVGPHAEATFLRSLARGELTLEAVTQADLARMADLVERYASFPLGAADASVIAIAERLGATRIATIDHDHFRAVKPAHCDAFELLPAGLVIEKRPRKAKRGHDTKH
jgi:predicted nucleic acid-binding protein